MLHLYLEMLYIVVESHKWTIILHKRMRIGNSMIYQLKFEIPRRTGTHMLTKLFDNILGTKRMLKWVDKKFFTAYI